MLGERGHGGGCWETAFRASAGDFQVGGGVGLGASVPPQPLVQQLEIRCVSEMCEQC